MQTLRFFVISALFTLPFFSFAQTDTASQSYNDLINTLLEKRNQDTLRMSENIQSPTSNYLDVTVYPTTPGPNIPVQIKIESYLTDLYKANISWSVNGQVLSRGMGRTSFTFQNGSSGETTGVTLSIITNTGESVTKNFYFTPVGVTIMWEADTYTPPFYKGKALLSPEAGVRIVAIPEMVGAGNPLGPSELVYVWKKNDTTDTSASGFGKNAYSFVGPKPLANTKITLEVSSLDDHAQSEMRIYLPIIRPFILFYKKDPLLGTWYNTPLDTETTLNTREFSMSAEPYFFSNERGDAPSLRYMWSVNGKDVRNYGRTITLRNDTGTKGASLISLHMRGMTNTFQTAKNDLRVNFTEDKSSSRPIF